MYARRWQSAKTGKSGYTPACVNEWKQGVCRKPKGSCKGCDKRELLPLTDDELDRFYLFIDEIQMSDEVPNPYNPSGKLVQVAREIDFLLDEGIV